MYGSFVTAALALRHVAGAATTEVVGGRACDSIGNAAPLVVRLDDPLGKGEA
jgi:hypothetical protein